MRLVNLPSLLPANLYRLVSTFLMTLMFAGLANAALVRQVDGNGLLTGATGVDVGGVLYDVQFVDGTCEEAFPGCMTGTAVFMFQTDASAFLASAALLSQVLLDLGPGQMFDSDPGSTKGCLVPEVCRFYTPVSSGGGVVAFDQAVNSVADADDLVVDLRTTIAFVDDQATVWALWSPSRIESVPEPSSLALLGMAGVALGWSRRRRQFRTNDRAQ